MRNLTRSTSVCTMIVRNVLLLSPSDNNDSSIHAIYPVNAALYARTCSCSRVEMASMRRVSCGRMSGAQRSEIQACCSCSIAEPLSASADGLSRGSVAKSSSSSKSMSIADMRAICRRDRSNHARCSLGRYQNFWLLRIGFAPPRKLHSSLRESEP
jgi:hypothetical protein